MSQRKLFPFSLRSSIFAAAKKGCSIVELDDGWFCFATPFFNRVNDGICVYVKNDRGIVRFSDDGEALDLYLLGGKSMADARALAAGLSVTVDEKECAIVSDAKEKDAGEAFLRFLNAAMAFGLG